MGDSIKVAVRLRKLIQREEEQKADTFWAVRDNSVSNKIDAQRYDFDRVYDQDATTMDIYNELVAPILGQAMIGFNGTVFAYGQTSSGKTYTMLGGNGSIGIIPMCASEIYNEVENRPDREFLVRVSYMEIYNENVVDLLSEEKSERKSLNVYDKVDGRVVVKDLTEEVVTSAERIKQLVKRGEASRHYGATNMNERSSRSHTIFRVIIESRERVSDPRASFDGTVFGAHLNLVDLAGSEKARLTGATGQRLTEGGFINKSLLTLSQVINQLASNSGSHIPYRDSKLTRILQNALGGNSKTAIICAVTPASFEETHSTLRFASSAKKITNRPQINELFSDDTQMGRMQREIASLKRQLEMRKPEDGDSGKLLAQSMNKELQQKLEEKERQQQEQEEKIKRLQNLISVSSRLKPEEDEDARQKKRRRETWCPGKGRPSKFGAGPMPSFVEEEPIDMAVDEDVCFPVLIARAAETQTDLRFAQTLDPLHENAANRILIESLNQRVTVQDAQIEELQVSLATMEDHYNKLLYTKETEIAELRSSHSVATADLSIQTPDQLDSTVCAQSPVCEGEIVTELRERLCRLERENSELAISLKNTTEELERALSQCQSAHNELEATKSQLSESMLFCASLVEKISALETHIEALKEEKKSNDQDYNNLVTELQELSEFTKYEKQYRDASFEAGQEKAQRDMTEQLVSLEAQLRASRDREEMLKTALSEQKAESEDAVLTRPAEPERIRGEMVGAEIQTDSCESDPELLEKVDRLERALEESDRQVNGLKSQIAELERVSLEPGRKDPSPEVDSVREDELNQRILSLQEQLSATMRDVEELTNSLEEQASLAIDAQNEVIDLKEETFTLKNALEEKQGEISKLRLQLETKSKVLDDRCSLSISEKSPEDETNNHRTGKFFGHLDESQAFNQLQSKYDKTVSDLKVARDQLLISSNKDLEIQKYRTDLERVVKETNTAVAQSNQENKALVDRLNKEVCELNCQLQKSSCDLQLAEHRLAEAERAKAQLKCEITMAEGQISRQEFASRKGPGDADPEKLMERIKKMTVQNDLTTQRCQNYEAKIKSMEVAAQKYESAVFERDSLQMQLREAQHQFQTAREEAIRLVQARNNSYSETAQMTLHVTNLEARLQNVTSQKEALQYRLDEAVKEQQCSAERLDKLSIEMLEKNAELQAVNQSFVELTQQVVVLRSESEAKTNENAKELDSLKLDSNARESEYRQQIDVLSNEKETIKSELKLLQEQKITSEAELERVMAEREAFRSELDSIRNQLKEEVLGKSRRQSNVSSEKCEPLSDAIEKVRTEEMQKWTKLLQEAEEKQAEDSEKQRRQYILEVQRMAEEKLCEIQNSLEQRNQEELFRFREQHQRQLGEVQTENDKLRSSLAEHDEWRHRLEQDLRDMESEKADVEVVMTKKEAEIEDLEEKLREVSAELEATRRDCRNRASMTSKEHHEQLVEALRAEHRTQLDGKERELETLKRERADEIETLEEKFQEEKTRLSAEHRVGIESLEQRHSKALEESAKVNAELEQRLEDLRLICDDEMKELDAERQSYERRSAESAEQQERLAQQVSKLLEMLKTAEAKHGEACVVLAKLEDEHRFCAVTVGEHEQTIAQLRAEISGNREALLQQSELLGRRVAEVEELSEKVALLNAAKEQEANRREELESRYNGIILQHDELTVEFQRQRSGTELEISKATRRLEESLSEAERKRAELESEMMQLKAKSEKDEIEIKELENHNRELFEESLEAGKRVSQAQVVERRTTQLAADAPRLRRERNELRDKVSELDSRIRSLDCELSAFKAEAVTSENRYRGEIERLRSEKGAADLEAKLKDSQSLVAKLRIDVSRLETRLMSDIDPLKAKLRSLASDLNRSEAQVRKLKDETAKLKDENRKLQTSVDELKSASKEDKKPDSTAGPGTSSFGPGMYSDEPLSGGGVITGYIYHRMEADCVRFKTANEKLERQLASEREKIAKLQRTIQDLEKKISCCDQEASTGGAAAAADVPCASPGLAENQARRNQLGLVSPDAVQKLLCESPNPFELSREPEPEALAKCIQQ